MRRACVLLLAACAWVGPAWAQSPSMAVTYAVQSVVSDATTTTLTLDLDVTNATAGPLQNVRLRLLSPAGAETQGELVFDVVPSSGTRHAVALFVAPRAFFDGETAFDGLYWKLTYVNAQGETQLTVAPGVRR